jgi:hypothetical protein
MALRQANSPVGCRAILLAHRQYALHNKPLRGAFYPDFFGFQSGKPLRVDFYPDF